MKVRLHEEAVIEAEEAARWYSQQQRGLGKEFTQELKRCLRSLRANPTRLPLLETAPPNMKVRRALTARFPYKIIFEIIQNEVVVLAVAHGSRRPDYWIKRRQRPGSV